MGDAFDDIEVYFDDDVDHQFLDESFLGDNSLQEASIGITDDHDHNYQLYSGTVAGNQTAISEFSEYSDSKLGDHDTANLSNTSRRQPRKRPVDWRAALVPKRPKILKEDQRRFYIKQFCNACNASDVDSLWDFTQRFTTPDIKFYQRCIDPPPPFDQLSRNLILHGRAAFCEYMYSRFAVIPDTVMTAKETKLIIRSDGTALIRSACGIRGSPVMGPDVLLMFERNVITNPFRIHFDNNSSSSGGSSSASSSSSGSSITRGRSSSSIGGSSSAANSSHGTMAAIEISTKDSILITEEEAPNLIYQRVQRTIMRFTKDAAAVATELQLQQQQQKQEQPVKKQQQQQQNAIQIFDATAEPDIPPRLSTQDLLSLKRNAGITITMHVNDQFLINKFEMVFAPTI